MRIVAHNMLKCNVKGVNNGYPLKIVAESIENVESDQTFDPEVMKTLLGRLDTKGLVSAANDLEMPELNFDLETVDVTMLERIHEFLFNLSIKEGKLICPESGREFAIKDGIPSMLLHEDEIS